MQKQTAINRPQSTYLKLLAQSSGKTWVAELRAQLLHDAGFACWSSLYLISRLNCNLTAHNNHTRRVMGYVRVRWNLDLNRSMAVEKDRVVLTSLLAPVDRSAIYFGKALSIWLSC